jgi:peptidoglycan hydrolase CwlO-like protein
MALLLKLVCNERTVLSMGGGHCSININVEWEGMNKKKLIHTLVAVSLILTCNVSVLADPLSDLLKEKQAQEQMLNQQNSSLSETQNKLEQLETAIERLDAQIDKMMRELENNKVAIAKGEQNILEAKKEVDKAEENIAAQQKLYDERMRALYKTGTKSYVEMLLNSKNLGDLILKIDAVSRITEFDKKLVRELEEKKAVLEEKKANLEAENKKLVDLKNQNEQKLAELNKSKESQLPLIAQAREERARVESSVKDVKDKLNSVKSRLDALYASAAKVQPSRGGAPFSTDAAVVYAYNFIGTKYVYGGTTPSGFDCSGFTRYVYAHFGINLPRTSDEQFGTGTPVSIDKLQPGDLVFFGDGGDVSHVGMYVGDGCYIHSPQTGDYVKVSVLSTKRYMGARRVR